MLADDQVAECVANWKKLEDEFYAGVARLPERERGAKVAEWAAKASITRKPYEDRLATIVGPAGMKRLRQIELQLRGPGTVISKELAEKFKVPAPEQN